MSLQSARLDFVHAEKSDVRVIGRYALYDELAAGGMATVHLARLRGEQGFARTVAIKRLHPQFAKDPEFVHMFLDEARLASRIQHPNVVSTLDVVSTDNELFLVMEYVSGESLSRLLRFAVKQDTLPEPRHVASVVSGALHGLHAAHEAKSHDGEPLCVVHRDVSPQNILVGTDGIARVLDFGVAKATQRAGTTREGMIKGKLAYMAPEQLLAKDVDRRVDIFATGIVLWESLCGRRLFAGGDTGTVMGKVLNSAIPRPSSLRDDISPELDDVVMKALEREADARYQTAGEFATALEETGQFAGPSVIGKWVREVCGENLTRREALVEAIEKGDIPDVSRDSFASVSGTETRPDHDEPPTAVVTPGTTSEIVTAKSAPQAIRESKRQKMIAGGIAAVLLLIGGLVYSTSSEGETEPAAVPEEQPLAVAKPEAKEEKPAEPKAEEPPKDEASVDLADLPEEAEEQEPETEEPAATAKSGVTQTPAPAPRPTKLAPRPKPKAASNCNPPFTIDAKGIRRIKPGCL